MLNATHRRALYLTCLMLALNLGDLAVAADGPAAGRDAERQAKTAVPQAGETIIYAYRPADTATAPLGVAIDGRDTARLTPGTFAMWRAKPGRHTVSAEGGASNVTLQCEGGRVCYVELARAPSGTTVLRPVSFGTGRAQVQRSRLVAPAVSSARPRAGVTAAPIDGSTRGAFMFKLGSFSLGEKTQTILGNTQQFNSSASSVLALEGEWFFQPDMSLGGEFFKYSNNFTTGGSSVSGQADTTVFLANIKRYFVLADGLKPYVGAGAGFASTDFSGAITGSTSGPALQIAGGLQWRRGPFALRGEYKYLRAKTKDDNGQHVDMSGGGLFLGAGFYF